MTMEEVLAMVARRRLLGLNTATGKRLPGKKSKFKWTPKNRELIADYIEEYGDYDKVCNIIQIDRQRFDNFLDKKVMFRLEVEKRMQLYKKRTSNNEDN